MIKKSFSPLFVIVIVYFILFNINDRKFNNEVTVLTQPFPSKVYLFTSGNLKQIISEILFIRTSVFLGGVPTGVEETSYEQPLADSYAVMTDLYPEFIDPYFYVQSFLAPISVSSAKKANRILFKSIELYPENFMLRFFYAFNFYYYLDQPIKSAEAFERVSELQDAPKMFGHLAAIFKAEGGNILAGLISLQALVKNEKHKATKERYEEEIITFKSAHRIELAITKYTEEHSSSPQKLSQLIPDYLSELPEINKGFTLVYDPPYLSLQRAGVKKF